MNTSPITKDQLAGQEVAETAQQNNAPLSVGRQFTLVSTLAAYSAMLLVGISHHEPWADEAHAWLLSRDLGYRYLIFHQLAYEGHPPLWGTILWVATHWFHLPYQYLGWIGGLCGLAGCWFFCRYSPFPLFVRVLFPFTYFMAYQYAIVARPYVLLPLFVFAAAHFFAGAEQRPWRFVAAVSGAALLCAPGVMFAVGIVAARASYTLRTWSNIPPQARKQLIGALIVFGVIVAFVGFVNWPPADRVNGRFDRPVPSANRTGHSGVAALPDEIAFGFFGFAIPSMVFLVVVGAWCASRSRLLPFALPLVMELAFFVKVYGNLWHLGALIIITVAAVWIAWPHASRVDPRFDTTLSLLVLAGTVGLFAVQIYWTGRTLAMDYSRPYSGSLDAANFLRSVGADATTLCGFGFHSSAIQPYFRGSIFGNWPKGEAFWRFEQGNRNDQSCNWPRWVVLPRCCTFDTAEQDFYRNDLQLRSWGYNPIHISRGWMFFEGREGEPTDFVIYERQ